MCVKLFSGGLNPEMTIALNMHGGSTLKGDGMYMYILTL